MEQPGARPPAPGPLALVQDFVNTADLEGRSDALRDPADLTAFWTTHGGDPADLSGVTAADVAHCRDLRESLRAACRAHAGCGPPAPTRLNELLDRGPLTLRLDAAGDARLAPAPGLTGVPLVIATVATAVAEAVAAGTWPRLKACESDPCQWVYYDRSRAARSRWCTMAICGSRAKMRAYRSRST
jgi:predicted RNA-binding Zn ribbon-like protein